MEMQYGLMNMRRASGMHEPEGSEVLDQPLDVVDSDRASALGKARSHLRHIHQARRSLAQVANESWPRRRLALRRPAFRVQLDELECVRERQLREFASGIFSQSERPAINCAAKADVSLSLIHI